jgi:hypothetical protein
MWQATTGEVRLDAGEVPGEVRLDERKAARRSASAQSTGGFDRLLRTTVRHLPLPKAPEGATMATNDPGIRGMSDQPAQGRRAYNWPRMGPRQA